MHVHRTEYYVPLVYPSGLVSKKYTISNYGNIKNGNHLMAVDIIGRYGTHKSHVLRRRVNLSEKGYTHQSQTDANKWSKTYFISKLVWCSFKYIPDEGYEIHHKDENPLNDCLWNLQCLDSMSHKIETSKLRSNYSVDDIQIMVYIMSIDNWDLDQLCSALPDMPRDMVRGKMYRILRNASYYESWFNVNIKPYTNRKHADNMSEQDVRKICEILSRKTWRYEDVYRAFGKTFPKDHFCDDKFYDIIRSIYRRKNHKEISKDYTFGTRIRSTTILK